MEKYFYKKYKSYRHENLDELLQEMNLPGWLRWISKKLNITTQLVKKDKDYYQLRTTALYTTTREFKLDVEEEILTADGGKQRRRKVKNSFHIEGNKLIEKQIGEKSLIIVREYFDDELIVTATMGSTVCRSWFKPVQTK
ncbi:CLUMA_CG015418, isoform B [Clunio marinus]|uniref:CLUMA_CG015418, isoform B n=1 Tax=Clunio marinus TaxID=568069 RepID=A0A1J1IQF1_9DIPT|nr:CLUMA_CG015418, isoform B [Clunio marinus]